MRDREPELIESRDYVGVASASPPDTLIAAAAAHYQMIWNKVLNRTGRSHGRSAAQRAADRAADRQWATDKLGAFIDAIYDRIADMTKSEAMREITRDVRAVATILDGLKRGQRLRDAMTREQFRARYLALTTRRKA